MLVSCKMKTAALQLLKASGAMGGLVMLLTGQAYAASHLPSGAPCIGRAYVTNSGSDDVSVIDTRTNQVIATLKTGPGTVNPTFTRDGRQVYVSHSEDNSISIIDVSSNKVSRTIKTELAKPSGLTFSPDGKRLILTFLQEKEGTPGHVGAIDLASGKLIWKVPVGEQPERIALTPDGRLGYVANIRSDTVSVVDVEKGRLLATIAVGDLPFNVLISKDGSRAYVGNVRSDNISVIDTSTHRIVQTIPTAKGPNGMSFSPDGKSVILTNVYGNSAERIVLETGKSALVKSVGELPGFVRQTADGRRAYFARPYGTTVSVIDTTTFEIVDAIKVGTGPSVLAMCDAP